MNHWNELAKLQASHIPVNTKFYISIIVAVLILAIGLFIINFQKKPNIKTEPKIVHNTPVVKPEPAQTKKEPVPEPPVVMAARPPRLNLPKNIAEIAAKKYEEKISGQKSSMGPAENPYNKVLAQIFSENGYILKPNITIEGLTVNLFAIGNNEMLWLGAIDCEIDDLIRAANKLDSIFKETLEDITIHMNVFLLDTLKKYPANDSIMIFHDIEEVKQIVSENPADKIEDSEQESFNSYSEYIDTIVQYIKNL